MATQALEVKTAILGSQPAGVSILSNIADTTALIAIETALLSKGTTAQLADGSQYRFDPNASSGGLIPTSGGGRWFLLAPNGNGINVKAFGAVGDGVTNDTVAIQNALNAFKKVYFPSGTYLINAKLTTGIGNILYGDGVNSVIKKGYNGYILNLYNLSVVDSILFDGNKANFTGGGIEINSGGNAVAIEDQGKQVIQNCFFKNTDSYHIDYTTANKGWISRVVGCSFSGTNADASIKWPDETVSGGNRIVKLCYSDGVIVNLGGCDNGIITENVIGGIAATNQGVLFPAGTTYGVKKVIISCNRFGISTGTINLNGDLCIFTNNEVSGNVTVDNGTSNLLYIDNQTNGTFTDNSTTTNQIFIDKAVPFTPTITTISAPTTIGNADLRCEYTRAGSLIRAKYFIQFGNTTSFGTGIFKITLPKNRITGLTTSFVGSAYVKAYACVAVAIFASGEDNIILYTGAGAGVSPTTPAALGNGDQIIISLEYRIATG